MSKSAEKDVPPSFEEAMDELDGIVQAMEGDRLSLSELIEQYARGTKLEKVCREQLAVARQRVESITEAADGSGEIEAEPFEPTTPNAAPESAKNKSPKAAVKTSQPGTDDEEDDEIRLF